MPEAVAETTKKQIKCSACGREAEIKKRLPTGWKRLEEEYRCKDCWRESYILRAISIQIAEPLDLSWEDLWTACRVMWRETTRASNWMVRQLALADVEREPGVAKMPPMPQSYLYPIARIQFPALPPQSVAAIEQAVTKKYKAKRYEIQWTCASSLPNFRYPQPFPIHNQSWGIAYENNSPILDFRIGDGRVKVRLKAGPRYRRQLAAIKAIETGTAIPGECAIYEQGTSIMVKLVAWLPRNTPSTQASGTLRVRSTPESLMVAVNEKDEALWTYNADQLPRWAAEHKRQLQRWADDSKFEQRPVPLFAVRRTGASLRYHRRINTAADQAGAYLMRYAKRRRFASVSWDDSDRSFAPEFVWFRLENRMRTLADEYGIEFIKSTPPAK